MSGDAPEYDAERVREIRRKVQETMDEALDITVDQLTAREPYVVRISRREMMALPLDVRRAVMERQTADFMAANPDYGEPLSPTDAPEYDAKRIGEINARLCDRNVRITYGVRDGNDYRVEDAQTDMEWLLSQLDAAWAYIRRLHGVMDMTAGYCRHEGALRKLGEEIA